MPLLKGANQCQVHYRIATTDIDEQGPGRQRIEETAVEQIAGLRSVRQYVDHVIGLCRHGQQGSQAADFLNICHRAWIALDT
ncbi:hypothetical protein D3C85_1817500 [compost metagenome]